MNLCVCVGVFDAAARMRKARAGPFCFCEETGVEVVRIDKGGMYGNECFRTKDMGSFFCCPCRTRLRLCVCVCGCCLGWMLEMVAGLLRR